ncbi:MAG: hypothetical protein U1G08_08540 [Verrucomicrobiota bacterium]
MRARPVITWILLLLTVTSFLITLLVLAVSSGLSETPFNATDAAGRPLGFNDPIFPSHLPILIHHLRPRALGTLEALYLELQGIMILVAIAWLASPCWNRSPTIRWFFLSQTILFPLGILGMLFSPLIARDLVRGGLDRESFTDAAAALFLAQPFWVAVALTAFFTLTGRPALPDPAKPDPLESPPGTTPPADPDVHRTLRS